MKRTYYIISTTNAQVCGWDVWAVCESRQEANRKMDEIPDFKGTDIEADTLRKNARIVSKTEARKYGINERYWEFYSYPGAEYIDD